MKVYYAHCQFLYGTKQEARDVALLEDIFDEVLNPNQEQFQKQAEEMKKQNKNAMNLFLSLVDGCEALAFRALPDGRIPAGVAGEIKRMRQNNGLIIELPSGLLSRSIDVEETREYLTETGQR
jgi:hypothetical protein